MQVRLGLAFLHLFDIAVQVWFGASPDLDIAQIWFGYRLVWFSASSDLDLAGQVWFSCKSGLVGTFSPALPDSRFSTSSLGVNIADLHWWLSLVIYC